MRSQEEFERARALFERGVGDAAIAREIEVPRTTIRDWRRGRSAPGREDCPRCSAGDLDAPVYAYLLGLYLGDGCLSSHPRGVWKLRIVLDARYPRLIDECESSIATIAARRSVHRVERKGCMEVYAYWKHWLCLFPQHGAGKKHERTIALNDWQAEIAHRHAGRLLRGLIHSDGCRSRNRIVVAGRVYEYPRYQFKNRSAGIREIFAKACEAFGVRCSRAGEETISVARSVDVRALDQVIGDKA